MRKNRAGSSLLPLLTACLTLIPLRAQDDSAALIARIEAAQTPNRQVIRDFKIHWVKA